MKTKEIKLLTMSLFVAFMCTLVSLFLISCQTSEEGKRLLSNYESAVVVCDWGPAIDIAEEAHIKLEEFGIKRLSHADQKKLKRLETEYVRKADWISSQGCGLNVFKKHFNGSKWECSNESYSMRFEENNGRIIEYTSIHLPGRDDWKKSDEYPYRIYEYYGEICVSLSNSSRGNGALWFNSSGSPINYVFMGMNRGQLRAVK